MRTVNVWLSVAFCAGLCAAGGCKDDKGKGPGAAPPAASARPDEQAIRGTWNVTGVDKGGKAIPVEELDRKHLAWTFDADKVTEDSWRGSRTGTYKLAPGRTPKEIDITLPEPAGPGGGADEVTRGTYELAGDVLTVYAPNQRGTATRPAAAAGGPDVTVLTLRRDASADAPDPDVTRLRGTWVLASVEQNGKAESTKDSGRKPTKWTFAAGDAFAEDDRGTPGTGTFRVNSTRSPKELDVKGLKRYGGATMRALYDLSGDTLKVCVPNSPRSSTRPSALRSQKGGGTDDIVLTFEREK